MQRSFAYDNRRHRSSSFPKTPRDKKPPPLITAPFLHYRPAEKTSSRSPSRLTKKTKRSEEERKKGQIKRGEKKKERRTAGKATKYPRRSTRRFEITARTSASSRGRALVGKDVGRRKMKIRTRPSARERRPRRGAPGKS